MEKPKEFWLVNGVQMFAPVDGSIHVIEQAPVLLALKQSKNAILSVIHTVDPRSPAGKELKLALDMIREIVP